MKTIKYGNSVIMANAIDHIEVQPAAVWSNHPTYVTISIHTQRRVFNISFKEEEAYNAFDRLMNFLNSPNECETIYLESEE